jgi:hypothetical protein
MPDVIDWTYVQRLYQELRNELEGSMLRINEVERIRFLEDKITLPPEEKRTGIELRLGATAELIENVKAALTANEPTVRIEGLRVGNEAKLNSSKREKFWRAYFRFIDKPVPVKGELADGQAGVGIGILKAVFSPWPKKERRRLPKESDKDYRERQKALKRKWGPPFRISTVHPLTFYYRLGAGHQIVEAIENGWKPRREVYAALGSRDGSVPASGDDKKVQVEGAAQIAGALAQPTEDIQPLPQGTDTTTLVETTEYWSPRLYILFVNGNEVYRHEDPPIKYFVALGRTTSSKDPDKQGLSVAEILRSNEPTINRVLTRMAEAAELLTHKRLTLELPEGGTIEMTEGEDNSLIPRKFEFTPDKAEALPPGSKVVDPYEGAENVYAAMPMIELVLRLMGQHGVSPIFKGVPPGAAGSGYRDNSLYLMARSQFQYLLDNFANTLEDLIIWLEEQIVRRARQEVFVYDQSLKPSDIRPWPAVIEVDVEPQLPQNLVQIGQFYDRMHSQGHITRRMVLEKGMKEEQPETIMRDRMLEDIQQLLTPILYQDVLQTVGAAPPPQPGLVGPDGRPIQSNGGGGPGGIQQLLAMLGQGGDGGAGQSSGGYSRAGQPRQPPETAGDLDNRSYVEANA